MLGQVQFMTNEQRQGSGPEPPEVGGDARKSPGHRDAAELGTESTKRTPTTRARLTSQATDWSKATAVRYVPLVKERGTAAVGWVTARGWTPTGRKALGGLLVLITLQKLLRLRRHRKNTSSPDQT